MYSTIVWTLGILLGLAALWFIFGLLGLALLYTAVFVYAKPGTFFSDVSEHFGDLEFNKSALTLGPITFIVGLIFIAVFLYSKYSDWRNPA